MNDNAKKTFKVAGMDCASCAQMIELDLEDAGIKATCSYPREELEVYIKNLEDEKKVKEIIKRSGYSLTL